MKRPGGWRSWRGDLGRFSRDEDRNGAGAQQIPRCARNDKVILNEKVPLGIEQAVHKDVEYTAKKF